MVNKDKILRLQADRMNLYLNMPEGWKIPTEILDEIARSPIGRVIPIKDRVITVTPSMISLANLILRKI